MSPLQHQRPQVASSGSSQATRKPYYQKVSLFSLGFLIALLGVFVGASAGAAPPFGVSNNAASPIISANPNNVFCIPGADPCICDPEPLPGIASLQGINANSYHINSDCRLTLALNFPNHNKPKIISDDAGGYTVEDVKGWIDMVLGANGHYEHYDGPLGDLALAGQIIDGEEDFPPDSIAVLKKMKGLGSDLVVGGVLTQSGPDFYWTGNNGPITLMGFGWPGALSSLNFDIEGYLDVLEDYEINFTRVFAIDQWTALATGCLVFEGRCQLPNCCPENSCTYDVDNDGCKDVILGNGRTPFSGSIFNGRYDLTELDPLYLSRMVQFVEAAANRGIVVQLSLFEHHGLRNTPTSQERRPGFWTGSPYNEANNINGFLSAGPSGDARADFLGEDGTDVGDVNSCFITTVVQQLSRFGNVIFEIMNEPKENNDWSASELQVWHQWVRGKVRGGACSNQPPHAEDDDGYSTAPNTILEIWFDDLTANDTDPDPGDTVEGPFYLFPQVTSQGGTLTWGNPHTVRYTPPPGFTGIDTFDYIITDRLEAECCGLVDVGTVTINVAGIVGPPAPK